LQADRLSACGFGANSGRLLLQVVAYAIVVLFREANAAVPEVATAQVSTLRQRLWKGGRWCAGRCGGLPSRCRRRGRVARCGDGCKRRWCRSSTG